MTDKRRELEELRQEIGKVDAQLLAALERRGTLSKRVGELRRAMEAPPALPQSAAVEELIGGAAGELPADALRAIFREIVATCHALERPVTVACAGPLDGAAHVAARSRFGVAAAYAPAPSVRAAVEEVGQRRADYAVVPFETRSEGLLAGTIAALTESEMKIVGVFERERAAGDASEGGAQDERVRYAIVGARPATRTGSDLTGMVVSVDDAPGALHEVLRQFAERGVNLTRIQSRPIEAEGWRYLFFLEVEGHATDRALVGSIEEVRRLSRFFKVLGSYHLT